MRVDTNDNNDNSNHEVTDSEDENSIEGSDSSNGNIAEYVVPKKKIKKELLNPKLSWFEENVIQKNIKEREEFAKKIGIDKIADEVRKTAKWQFAINKNMWALKFVLGEGVGRAFSLIINSCLMELKKGPVQTKHDSDYLPNKSSYIRIKWIGMNQLNRIIFRVYNFWIVFQTKMNNDIELVES